MVSEGHRAILDELRTRDEASADKAGPQSKKLKVDLMDIDVPSGLSNGAADQKAGDGALVGGLQPRRLINLENLVFDQGNHLMTNPNVKLPQGSTKRTFKGYEEIHVPAPKAKRDAGERNNMPTTELPDWARQGSDLRKS
jgi:pre-mRNA-splicing helicase BRR2